MKVLNTIALTLVIIGGLNWLLVGAFQFDLVAYIFGSQVAPLARAVYILVGLAALYCISFYRYFCSCSIKHDVRVHDINTNTMSTTRV